MTEAVRKSTAESVARGLVGPSLRFDLTAETKALLDSSPWRVGGHAARTLVMHPDFRLVLITLRSENRLSQHRTDQRISVHVLTGHVRMRLSDQTVDLPAGQVLVLDKAILHDVVAVEDSTFLLSLSGNPSA